MAGDNAVSDTRNIENDSEMKKEAEQTKLWRMAKVHDFLEMWQGSQILRVTEKEISRSKQPDDSCRIHFGH